MVFPPQLESDVEIIKTMGHKVTLKRDPPDGPRIYVIITEFQLPPGWKIKETDLIIIADINYPNSKLDMFWVDTDVLLVNGTIPQAAGCIETHLGREWRRFSWHLRAWRPGVDNIVSYIDTIKARLRQIK